MSEELFHRFLQLKRAVLEQKFNRMNESQRQAVFQAKGPVLILAGAGSGKTTVVVNRIANLVKYGNGYHSEYMPPFITKDDLAMMQDYLEGWDADEERLTQLISDRPAQPWQILAITFTNKAAGELKQRLESMLGEDAREIQASTFHSACVRILRREIEALGYPSSFTIYDSDDSLRVVKECMKSLNISDKTFPPRSMLGAISRAKDSMISPQALMKQSGNDFRVSSQAKVYEAYQKRLKSSGAVDFDDIIALTVRLFQENPEILEKYQRRWQYIMVDEYQDTNHAQYLLVSMLAQGHKNLCVVGDDDQSIYKFRGATIENILSFEQQFPGAMVIRLEQNYRSTSTILDAANAVIAHNTERKGKNLWTQNETGEPILIFRGADEEQEGGFIADTILSNVADGAKFSDHAVLYRMNAQSNMIERSLVKSGIPYRIIGGLRFYERKEIKDILAYLHVLNNPADRVRLKRIINEPKRGIGDATVAAAEEIADHLGISLFETFATADQYAPLSRKAGPVMAFTAMMKELQEEIDEAHLEELVDHILEKTGYEKSMLALGDEGKGRLENIEELKSNLIKYSQENEEPTLSGFLEEISLYTDLDNLDPDADNVIMMTLHSAKGLEFPYVFIAGVEEGIFPGNQSMFDPAQVEEERRLAYVGITRAKKRLFITTAASRMLFGQTTRNRISRFAGEIPKDLYQMDDRTVTLKKASSSLLQPQRPAYSASATQIGIGFARVQKKNPDEAAFSQQTFAPGKRIVHKSFGEGMIVSMTPMAGDVMMEVAFDKVGTKKIMLNFAARMIKAVE